MKIRDFQHIHRAFPRPNLVTITHIWVRYACPCVTPLAAHRRQAGKVEFRRSWSHLDPDPDPLYPRSSNAGRQIGVPLTSELERSGRRFKSGGSLPRRLRSSYRALSLGLFAAGERGFKRFAWSLSRSLLFSHHEKDREGESPPCPPFSSSLSNSSSGELSSSAS
jgi:hypothetical protein